MQTTPEGSTTPTTTPSTTPNQTKPNQTTPSTTKPVTDPVTTNPPTVLDTFEFDLAMNKTLSDRFEMVVIDVSSSKLLKVQSTSAFKYSGADGANYYGHNIVGTDTYCHGTPEQGAILDLNTRETYLAAIAFTAPVEGTYRFRADLTRLYWVGGDSNATSHYLLVYNDYNSRASSTKYNAKTTPTKTDSASVSHDYTIDLKAGQKLVMVIERVANTTGNHRTGINSITVDLTKSKNPYTTTAQRSNAYTCARAAQYKLVNDISNLYMLSTISETCDPTTDDMDPASKIHYSQKTFNKMGKEMAENLYSVLGLSDTANVYGGIRVSAKSGKILLKTDEDGNAESGDYYLTQANTGGRIQIALNTLGNNNTVSYTLKNGSTDLSSYINAYGVIDWTGLSSKGVTEILVKVEYK